MLILEKENQQPKNFVSERNKISLTGSKLLLPAGKKRRVGNPSGCKSKANKIPKILSTFPLSQKTADIKDLPCQDFHIVTEILLSVTGITFKC